MVNFTSLNGYYVRDKQAIRHYDTLADMKADVEIKNNMIVKTNGYYNYGDGGQAIYKIREITNQDVINEMTLIALNDETLLAEFIPENDTINVKQFGAIGDGETDETSILKEFISYNVNKYIFNKGTYLIDDDLLVTSNSNIEFEDGAKIKRKTNSLTTYFMLNLIDVDNVSINNAYLIGDRQTHTGNTGEWGHGINVIHSTNIKITNSYIEQTWGDGIYVGFYSGSYTPSTSRNNKDIVIDNLHTYKCSRAGIQVSSAENVLINNCHLEYTDRYSSQVGINLEAEGPEGTTPELINVSILNTKTNDNTYNGIQIYLPTNKYMDKILIDNHYSYNESVGFAISGTGQVADNESIIYKNSSIVLCKSIPILIKDKGLKCGLNIDNILIDSSSRTQSMDGYGIVRIQNTRASYPTGNIIINNIKLANTYGGNFWNTFMQTPNNSEDVGTIQDIEFSNIHSINNMFIINTANSNVDTSKIKFTNCKFDYVGTYATIPIARQTYTRVIRPSLQANSSTSVGAYIPDGDYEIIIGNRDVYSYTITFNDVYSVCKGDYTLTDRSFTSGKCGSIMKFTKIGTTIIITDLIGFTVAQ